MATIKPWQLVENEVNAIKAAFDAICWDILRSVSSGEEVEKAIGVCVGRNEMEIRIFTRFDLAGKSARLRDEYDKLVAEAKYHMEQAHVNMVSACQLRNRLNEIRDALDDEDNERMRATIERLSM